jgi:hypothetical protein
MEFSINTVATKMILIILCLSVLIMIGSVAFFYIHPNFETIDAVPFSVGVVMAMGLNAVKVIWLKKTINKTVDMKTPRSAKLFFQLQYFLRIVFTGVILLIAALAPDNIINLLGVIIGILAFPISMRFIKFFIPPDVEIPTKTPLQTDFIQDSVNEIEALGKED